MSGLRSRSEDGNLHAATAQIEVLCGAAVAEPTRLLTDTVIDVHSRIAAGAGVPEETVDSVDQRRYEVIDLFKADVRIAPARSTVVS
jgi:DNA-binding transcriptional regulator YbjK